ncbi:MAG: hypothetical protein PVI00_03925 [Desulfobacterales bacterium]|jgi:hypothetical protein
MAFTKKSIIAIMSLALTVFVPASVLPYVLQGPHIIQLITEKLGQANSLFVSQRVIFYNVAPEPEFLDDTNHDSDVGDSIEDSDVQPVRMDNMAMAPADTRFIELEESIRYLFSRAFRSDIVSDTNQRIYVYNGGRTLTVIDGEIARVTESRFDLYKDLLLYRSRESLSRRLMNLGIDIRISSLGKFEDQLALVIGAEFPDETAPQLWVDKATFQPQRLIVPSTGQESGGTMEIRYAGWQPIGNTLYPMQIEFIQDGTIVRKVEVRHYQINPNFSEDLFNIGRLMSEYRHSDQMPEHSGNQEGLSEVQRTIEEFKKIFE